MSELTEAQIVLKETGTSSSSMEFCCGTWNTERRNKEWK